MKDRSLTIISLQLNSFADLGQSDHLAGRPPGSPFKQLRMLFFTKVVSKFDVRGRTDLLRALSYPLPVHWLDLITETSRLNREADDPHRRASMQQVF